MENSLFPYEKFGYRLEFGEKKNTTICWFECEEHLQKHLIRYKLDKRTIKIDYRDGEPVVRSEKHKGSVEQKSKSKSNRSSGAIRKGKSSVDTSGNTARIAKRKK